MENQREMYVSVPVDQTLKLMKPVVRVMKVLRKMRVKMMR